MLGGFLLVLAGNVLRLGAGLLVFLLLARQLGPSGFGSFSYGLALASLAVVPVNFGLATVVLRRFGAEPGNSLTILAEALTAKLLIAFPLLGLLLLAALWLPAPVAAVFLLLLLAQVVESFAELYQLAFRANSEYQAEAAVASAVSLLHIGLMAAVAWTEPHPLACAWAFFGSRMLGLLITAWLAQRCLARIPLAPLADAIRLLKGAVAYAVELGLGTANTQLDSLLIQAQLGLRAVGIYQAGMKLVQGIFRLAPILALYLLPRLTRSMQPETVPTATAGRDTGLTLAVFAGIGLISGGLMAAAAEPLALKLFGPAFAELASLLPWFGLLLALRFIETGAGLVLVAADLQRRKVGLVALQLLVLIVGGSWALTQWGLLGWLLTAIGSTLLLLALYALLWWRSRPTGQTNREA